MSTQLDMSGFTRFLAGLDAAIDAGNVVNQELIVNVGQQIAPVDEGDWRDSIQPDGEVGNRRVIAGGADAPHGIIVEYGDPDNPNYPAQPTMAPAAAAIDPGIEVSAQIRDLAARSAIK